MKTENATRLEIETGKGGVLLICSRLPPTQAKELASLFRRNCLDGQVIFVLSEPHDLAADADAFVPDVERPGSYCLGSQLWTAPSTGLNKRHFPASLNVPYQPLQDGQSFRT
jgi:hypothetical protein